MSDIADAKEAKPSRLSEGGAELSVLPLRHPAPQLPDL